ncbi:MAG: hypothetical protein ABI193_15010 [Minicystis sp.]
MNERARSGSGPEPAAESARAPDLLDDIADQPRVEGGQRITPGSGRILEAERAPGGEDRVTIRAASGEVELSVLMTAQGPVLRFRAADLELASTKDVRVRCDNFKVEARGEISHESQGDLRQRTGGNASVKVRGKLSTKAAVVSVEAKRGGVQIEASDDVEILGERIKLNC